MHRCTFKIWKTKLRANFKITVINIKTIWNWLITFFVLSTKICEYPTEQLLPPSYLTNRKSGNALKHCSNRDLTVSEDQRNMTMIRLPIDDIITGITQSFGYCYSVEGLVTFCTRKTVYARHGRNLRGMREMISIRGRRQKDYGEQRPGFVWD